MCIPVCVGVVHGVCGMMYGGYLLEDTSKKKTVEPQLRVPDLHCSHGSRWNIRRTTSD